MRRLAATFVLALTMSSLAACSPENDQAVVTENIVVEVQRDGTILYNGDKVDAQELERRLRALSRDVRHDVHLRAEPEARFADIDKVAGILKRTGNEKIGVILQDGP